MRFQVITQKKSNADYNDILTIKCGRSKAKSKWQNGRKFGITTSRGGITIKFRHRPELRVL